MNPKAFFGAALSSALELGIAVPDDLLRHATPDVLAVHLPRPLWARLLTACLGAPRVDAQLVVETIGIPNLCEHVPAGILWACIEELAVRALGGVVAVPANAHAARPVPLTPPPPPAEPRTTPAAPIAVGPTIPPPGSGGEVEAPDSVRMRPSSPRFRPTTTGIGRLAANAARRPLAHAAAPPTPPPVDPAFERAAAPPRARRSQTDSDFDLETHVGGKDDWKNVLAVEEEQLVDWSATDETATGNDAPGRKR